MTEDIEDNDIELTVANEESPNLNEEVCDTKKEPPDGGYGWVVAIASGFVQLFVLGNVYAFGVFFPEYIKAFDSSQSDTSWVGSVGIALMTGLGMYAGALTDYYGNGKMIFLGGFLMFTGYMIASYSTELWHLYLTQGVICGLGQSCAFFPAVGAVGQWFRKNRGLALGIALAGSGLGQLTFVFGGGALISAYGWRSALRILAIINIIGLTILSFLVKRFIPLKPSIEVNASWQMFRNPSFVLLYVSVWLNSLGVFMPLTFLIIYAQDHGISRSSAVFISAISGLASIIGRITCGMIADRFGKIVVMKVYMYGTGITVFCWLACTDFPTILVYSLIFAYFAGATISLLPVVCAELFGMDSLGSVLGLLFSAQALGNLISLPLGGFLHDTTKHYTVPIIVSGVVLMCGASVLFGLPSSNTIGNKQQQLSSSAASTASAASKSPPITVAITEKEKINNVEIISYQLIQSNEYKKEEEEEEGNSAVRI